MVIIVTPGSCAHAPVYNVIALENGIFQIDFRSYDFPAVNFHRQSLLCRGPAHCQFVLLAVFDIENRLWPGQIIEVPYPAIGHDCYMVFHRVQQVLIQPGVNLDANRRPQPGKANALPPPACQVGAGRKNEDHPIGTRIVLAAQIYAQLDGKGLVQADGATIPDGAGRVVPLLGQPKAIIVGTVGISTDGEIINDRALRH